MYEEVVRTACGGENHMKPWEATLECWKAREEVPLRRLPDEGEVRVRENTEGAPILARTKGFSLEDAEKMMQAVAAYANVVSRAEAQAERGWAKGAVADWHCTAG